MSRRNHVFYFHVGYSLGVAKRGEFLYKYGVSVDLWVVLKVVYLLFELSSSLSSSLLVLVRTILSRKLLLEVKYYDCQ